MNRYNTTPPSKSLTYFVLPSRSLGHGAAREYEYIYKAYDSATSAYLASGTTLEALDNACAFLGYKLKEETR